MLHEHEASPSEVQLRLMEQARLQGLASDTKRAYWKEVFQLTRNLGIVLHVARELLDCGVPDAPVPVATLRLWEQGLILPTEVTDGWVTETVRWYIDELRKLRRDDPLMQLAMDIFVMKAELAEHQTQSTDDVTQLPDP